MSSAKRNLQRRLAGKAGKVFDSTSPYALAKGVVGSVVNSMVPKAVSSAVESIGEWYYTREYVKKYGNIAGPIILACTTLTLSQAGQLMNIAKAASKIVWRKDLAQTVAPGVQQKYEYAATKEDKKPLPWEKIAFALSLISLKVGTVQPKKIPFGGGQLVTPSVPVRKAGMLYLLFVFLRWLGRTWWDNNKSPIGASLTTKIISATLTAGPMSSSEQRPVFNKFPLVQAKITLNHSHGESARDRNTGSATAGLIAAAFGLKPYYPQMSLSDVRKKRDGDRSFHWAKDIGVPAVDFHFDGKIHASVFVDVDEHMDMPHFLAHHPGTHFICTFQPSSVAKGDGEYTFRFLKDNQVQYKVSGGAEYTHHVWDYAGDTLIAESASYVQKTVVTYHIDRKMVDEHHCIIMLTVVGQYVIPTLLPTDVTIEGRRLVRLAPVTGNHVVLDVVRPAGIYRSVGILGSHIAVTLPKTAFDAVHAVAIIAKSAITAGMVDSNISPPGDNGMPEFKLGPGESAVVASYLREGVPLFPPTVYPPSACLIPIYYNKNGYDSRVPLAGFGSPLIGPNYAHASDLASDDRCISGRVEAFTKREFEASIPPTLAGYMVEFARFVVPDHLAHTGRPVSHEEVHERQDRPSQRNILDQAETSGPWYKKIFRTFVKIEEYQKVTDPRNITTVTPEAKLKNSRYMYAFHDSVMSQLKNYAFNKTPKEIATMITEILKNAHHSALADGHRFDGHVTMPARILERIIMFRYFHPDEYSNLNETLDEQIGLPGVTREGRRYTSHYTRGSGTLETSDFNSLLSMFIGYCGWRNTTIDGVKCSPDLAWASLGIYGGDDSLEGHIDPAALKRSAEMMGQDYEIEVVPRGAVGVNFLNRQFGPDVWTGDASSMANPKRALAKLWIGPANLPNPLERFAERISGYYRMDRNSPVLGDICLVAHALLGERVEGMLMPWDGKHSLESNWPNEDSGWMIDVFTRFIPDFDMDRFKGWMRQVCSTNDAKMLLQAPLCTPADLLAQASKVACVVGEELLIPVVEPKGKEEADEESTETQVANLAMTPEPSSEESAPVVATEFTVAKQAVPILNAEGLKVKAPLKQKAHKEPKAPTVKFDRNRPDLWSPPKNATPERMVEWTMLRAKVAKKLGISLP